MSIQAKRELLVQVAPRYREANSRQKSWILDDLGLHRLDAQQSNDLYELIISRHRRTSYVITSNRAVDEWLGLFDDPIRGNSALYLLANASYRKRMLPHRREVLTP